MNDLHADYEASHHRRRYKFHLIVREATVHQPERFACGRSQQICALRTTRLLAETTCVSCLKAMKAEQ